MDGCSIGLRDRGMRPETFSEAGRKEELPGLIWKKDLNPKLRSDFSHFAFSQDGKLLLAQDDFAITVIEREPLRALFQIPTEKAREAAFTLDGKFVVFTTKALRYEKWSVAEKKPVEVRELVLRRNCLEHKLAPDGNYLACVDTSMSVNILDTRTGMKMWEKKEFYPLTFEELLPWLRSTKDRDDQVNFFRIEFSPDSRFVMFSRSDRFRFRHEVDLLTVAASKDTALALDLTTLKPVEIGGDMKQISARPGDPQATFVINGSAAFVRFNLQGNKLFILSDAQSVYAFDLSKIAAKTTTQAK